MTPARRPARPSRRPGPAARLGRNARSAFTLLEMLIAIGVILVLMAFGILGYRSMERSTSQKQTKTILGTAESLLKGMSGVGAAARVEGSADQSPSPFYLTGQIIKAPADITIKAQTDRDELIKGTTGLALDSTSVTGGAMPKTLQRLMQMLLAVPANKAAIEGLQRDHLVMPVGSATPYTTPMLADAWGNPLILVPSGGLMKVKVNGTDLTTPITSTGLVRDTGKYPTLAEDPARQNRPFWASAGPDGNFYEGDDNIYSFEK
ncbi:MAG: hypothetical protein JWO31_2974 [Phycisphaerales bacterium]|nr:hypothetical protein [Phycisphaerales bacterium]